MDGDNQQGTEAPEVMEDMVRQAAISIGGLTSSHMSPITLENTVSIIKILGKSL